MANHSANNNGGIDPQRQHPLADIYLALMRDPELWTDNLDNSLRKIITAVATALNTRRVGLWSFGPDRRALTLLIAYEREAPSFSHGAEIQCAQFPEYFQRFKSLRVEAIADVQTDPRLHEFRKLGHIRAEMGAMLTSTINVVSRQWGSLTCVHMGGARAWTDAEQWFVASSADLIAQLIAYAEIRHSERWLRFVADYLPIGLLKFDLDANCDYANPHWQRLLGIDADASLGRNWLPWVHADDRANVLDAVRMVAQSGERRESELRLSARDKVIWAEASWVCDRNAEGFPVGVLGLITDVTHQRELRQSIGRLDRINSIAARLYGLRDVEAVARESVEILSGHGAVAPIVTFCLYDEVSAVATLIAQRSAVGEIVSLIGSPDVQWSVPVGETDINLITDIATMPIDEPIRQRVIARGTRSIVNIWLRREGNRIGVISLEIRETVDLQEDQRNDLLAIGKAISMALENVLFIQRIEHQATHDTLTGLPNRELLRRELLTLDNNVTAAAGLMLLDLDRFKEVNDTLGHHLGDQLLIKLGQRLSKILQEKNALLCRLGGDEFAVLVRDENPAQVQNTAKSLLDSLRQPFQVDDLMLEIGGSIGIALYPQHGESGGKLLRLADVAMYQAKRSGSGSAVYDPEFDLYTPMRLALIQELRAGIGEHQLLLYYQPKIDLRDNSISGFEALVRWQHPQRGLLAPGVFLPLAEMSDVIHALTIEVLEQALAQLREWSRRGLRYTIAVNLSARNLINEDCFMQLRKLLDKYGADPTLLELEITETALMQDPAGASKLLDSLTALGVRFSIDDFGTGYSSLAYLRQLPIRALKIDRAFVADMVRNEQDAMIVKSTIALAHNLKLDVIAEGVEDEATLTLLRDMGCDFAQGYFISRPQPAEAIERWVGANNMRRSARNY